MAGSGASAKTSRPKANAIVTEPTTEATFRFESPDAPRHQDSRPTRRCAPQQAALARYHWKPCSSPLFPTVLQLPAVGCPPEQVSPFSVTWKALLFYRQRVSFRKPRDKRPRRLALEALHRRDLPDLLPSTVAPLTLSRSAVAPDRAAAPLAASPTTARDASTARQTPQLRTIPVTPRPSRRVGKRNDDSTTPRQPNQQPAPTISARVIALGLDPEPTVPAHRGGLELLGFTSASSSR